MNQEFKIWFKNNYRIFCLVFLALIFFFFYSWLSLTTPLKFNSPDETANYFFIKQFVLTGEPKYLEPLNFDFGGIFHPRSTNVAGGFIVPGSFLGLILIYGCIAKIVGLWLVPYLTPLISVIAVLFFYGIIKKVFSAKIAFISALLFFLHPAIFYYASRGLFNNLLFLDLFIIGFYYLLNLKAVGWRAILAGLLIGLALVTRPVEVLWVGPILLVLFLLYHKNINWRGLILFILTLILTLLPILYYNQVLYGSPWATGYTVQSSVGAVESLVNPEIAQRKLTIPIILPFGFGPRTILKNFYHYGIELFWWLTISAVIGFLMILKNYKKILKEQKLFLYFFSFLFLFLMVYYGSWQTYDNLTPGRYTMGDSHIRYWLPLYVFSLPFVSLFLLKLASIFPDSRLKKALTGLLFLSFFLLSFNTLFFRDEESLLAVKNNLLEYEKISNQVFNLTEPDSAIITERSDKIFFPERKIITIFNFDFQALIKKTPVYYYTYTGDEDIQKLKDNELGPRGVDLRLVGAIRPRERLFELITK
jgi:hypothetical protein